ncbi:MAG: Sua5/YciO/YrdC/YwlC family protein, partial [Desulfobulbaceae bacterium]|nr:Sua5/YciO/YrdC/YwlC family protein [Desulfobulbaceae bacterium]
PRMKPILVLISDISQLDQLVTHIPHPYPLLMKLFWPGPLTLVFPAKSNLSPQLTGSTDTIGIRWSPNSVANDLIKSFGGPVTATSANRSGESAAVCPEEIDAIFGDDVDFVLGDGRTPGGIGSTLIGMQHGELCCIRSGRVSYEEVIRKIAD